MTDSPPAKRMRMHPPTLPTLADLKENVDEWVDFFEGLQSRFEELQCHQEAENLQRECRELHAVLKNMSDDELEDFASSGNAFVKMTSSSTYIRDIPCDADDCWYRGNLHRLPVEWYYRIKGYDAGEFKVCDVCWDNGHDYDNILKIIVACLKSIRDDTQLGTVETTLG